MKKRDFILTQVIEAFNEKGYHAYSLSDLAEICTMSRGNLAYHYKYKEAILDDISVRMIRDIKRYQKRRVSFPAFYNLSLDIRTCWTKEVIKRNLSTFAYGIEIGNVKPEPYEGLYYQLSVNAWLLTYYWVAQESVRVIGKEEAEKTVWSAIYPHFTDKGMEAFDEYYGDDFLAKSGVSIQQYMNIKHLI